MNKQRKTRLQRRGSELKKRKSLQRKESQKRRTKLAAAAFLVYWQQQ